MRSVLAVQQFSSFAVLAVYAALEVLTKIWVRSVLAVQRFQQSIKHPNLIVTGIINFIFVTKYQIITFSTYDIA